MVVLLFVPSGWLGVAESSTSVLGLAAGSCPEQRDRPVRRAVRRIARSTRRAADGVSHEFSDDAHDHATPGAMTPSVEGWIA
jgi:hypothetical protein